MLAEANRVLAALAIGEPPSRGRPASHERGRPLLAVSARAISRAGPGGRFQVVASGFYARRRRTSFSESGGGESSPLAHGEIEDGCRFSLAFAVPSAEPGPHRLVVRSYDPDSAYAITSAQPFEVTAEPAPERSSGWATYEDPAGSLSLSYPPGWFRAGIAHPNLADPTEFATLATFPLEARPGRCTESPPGEG